MEDPALRTCAVCRARFELLGRRVRCAHCARVVCPACAAYVSHAPDPAGGWRGRMGFCRPCHGRVIAVEVVPPPAAPPEESPEPLRVEVNGDPFFAMLCLKSEAARRGLSALADVRFTRPSPRTVIGTARPSHPGPTIPLRPSP